MARAKIDPVVTQRIVDLIRAGNYLEVAATAAGVHRTTLHRWMKRGREQERGRYRKFLVAVEKAQAEAESRDVALIAKAAGEDWRAAAWRLERKQPRRYGPRVQVSVQEELNAVIDRLERNLAPEIFEQVLNAIANGSDDAPEAAQSNTLPSVGSG